MISKGMQFLFTHPALFNTSLKFTSLVNFVPRSLAFGLKEWEEGRALPKFAKESFTSMWKKGKIKKEK